MRPGQVRVRRVYDEASAADGARVLVDRVWPRGLRREDAHVDDWARDVAPSAGLREWYGSDPERFAQFRGRYLAELEQGEARDALDRLRQVAAAGPVTLLTTTRDVTHSQAAVLAEVLAEVLAGPAAADDEPAGGEAACWLRRVCPACGALADQDPPTDCPRCGARLDG